MEHQNKSNLIFSNYCACFIDLLGQKNSLADQNLVPTDEDTQAQLDFERIAKESIGAILRLQRYAEIFRNKPNSSLFDISKLEPEQLELYRKMSSAKPKQQRWSDGLVYYHTLQGEQNNCPISAVYEIFALAGALCLFSLSTGYPIRGAIEISWGVELHDNELYGAIVANSYILESEVAKYPRIVIGEHTVRYLTGHLTAVPESKIDIYNQSMTRLCLDLIASDTDGNYILDYLGKNFRHQITQDEAPNLFREAFSYATSQLALHQKNKNEKLVLRYEWLLEYFEFNREHNL
ncbi:hypothetical protein [Pseudomonas sp. MWU318]|uniref:hypothetical protein n=1 Tax=Pseudomonas sp. MWU318 TaxID=2802569 RepID=UPI0019273324|nr:hypothetical protein [Pseudomonas sp. MWU318]